MGGNASVMYFASFESFLPVLPSCSSPEWSPRISSCQCSCSGSDSIRALVAWLSGSETVSFREFVALAEAESGQAPHPVGLASMDDPGAELVLGSMEEMRRLLKLLFRARFPVHRVPVIDIPLVFRLEFHYGSIQLAPFSVECFRVNLSNGEAEQVEWSLPREWDGNLGHQAPSVQKQVLTFALCLREKSLPNELVHMCINFFFASQSWSDI